MPAFNIRPTRLLQPLDQCRRPAGPSGYAARDRFFAVRFVPARFADARAVADARFFAARFVVDAFFDARFADAFVDARLFVARRADALVADPRFIVDRFVGARFAAAFLVERVAVALFAAALLFVRFVDEAFAVLGFAEIDRKADGWCAALPPLSLLTRY